jgi:CBS domain containing-hemolysin-like protein
MEDILEEIVGDIWDETDTIELEIEKTAENTYSVLGQTNIEEFFDEIDFRDREFESEYTTMGGWAVEMLEEDVHEGDSFSYKRLYVIVSEMGENVVERLTVVVTPSLEDERAKEKREERASEQENAEI